MNTDNTYVATLISAHKIISRDHQNPPCHSLPSRQMVSDYLYNAELMHKWLLKVKQWWRKMVKPGGANLLNRKYFYAKN